MANINCFTVNAVSLVTVLSIASPLLVLSAHGYRCCVSK